MDGFLHNGEDSTLECVRMCVKTVIKVFDPRYLRPPNEANKNGLNDMNEERG
jgi:hypothetical protein